MAGRATISGELTLGNSSALRTLRETQAAAQRYRQEIIKIQGTASLPLPDIARNNPNLRRTQAPSPFGREWEEGLRRGTERLRRELDRQAELYRRNNPTIRLPLPDINRVTLSGQNQGQRVRSLEEYRALMAPTRGAAGTAASKGGDAMQAYAIAQDLGQGGPGAVLNQLPIMLDLASRYTQKFTGAIKGLGPVMGTVTAAALAAGAYVAGGKAVEWFSGKPGAVKGDEEVAKWTADQEKKVKAMRLERARETAAETGAATGGTISNIAGRSGTRIAEASRAFSREKERRELEYELERERIKAIQDEAARAEASRVLEKKILQRETAARLKHAEENVRIAMEADAMVARELTKASADLDKSKAVGSAGGKSTEQIRLEALVAALNTAASGAKERVSSSRIELESARADSGNVRFRENIIDASHQNEQADRAARKVEEFWDKLRRGVEAAGRIAEAYEQARLKAAEQAKQQANLSSQLEIAEARSKGQRGKADRLQKAADLQSSTQKYLDAGYTPEEAAGMAQREQDARTRRPGQIRGAGRNGAGAGGGGGGANGGGGRRSLLDEAKNAPSNLIGRGKDPRPSLLDGQGFNTPSALDEYERDKRERPSIFTPRPQRPSRRKGDPATADGQPGNPPGGGASAPPQKADPAVTGLLEDIKGGINKLTGLFGSRRGSN